MNCQDCDTPLQVDDSLLHLTRKQHRLLLTKSKSQVNDDVLLVQPHEFINHDKLKLYHQVQEENPLYNELLDSEEDAEDEDEEEEEEEKEEKEEAEEKEKDEEANDKQQQQKQKVGEIDGEEVVEQEEDEDISFIDLDTSFILLDEEKLDQITSISGRINMLNKIFKILSNHSNIDHPLSSQCANLLLENYKTKFDQTNWEKDKYISFLRKLRDGNANETGVTSKKIDEIQGNHDSYDNYIKVDTNNTKNNTDLDEKLDDSIKLLNTLKIKQLESLNQLKSLESKKKSLQQDIEKYNNQLLDLNKNQIRMIYKNQNNHYLELQQANYKLNQQNSRYKYHLSHLDQLRAFNIYTTIFKIEINQYPLINLYRLGFKIVNQEINGGLGQIVFLLRFIIKRLQLKLENYQLVPLGSKSYIIKLSKNDDSSSPTKSQLNLFTSNEFSLGRLFNFNKLDISLLALLDVVHLIESRIKFLDHDIDLPYKIDVPAGLVGGKSIRITLNSEWTDGCKFLLINLNWILLWTSVNTE